MTATATVKMLIISHVFRQQCIRLDGIEVYENLMLMDVGYGGEFEK